MKFRVVHKLAGERLRGHVRALRASDGLFLLLDPGSFSPRRQRS